MSTRREFLLGAACLAGATGCATTVPGGARWRRSGMRFASDPFTLGVASGFPTPDSVVLWTRLAPKPLEPGGGMPPDASIDVRWEVATDERMHRIVRRGTFEATPEWAHSVHVEPRGLEPDREYWYRFTAGGVQSAIARTHTAPLLLAARDRLKLALVSCQQYEHGYYAAYRHILNDDPDLIVHNGDYIYESTWGVNHVRHHPFPQALTLDDYRITYALYKSDPDLLAAHLACPWIVTWDDHEVYNDYAGDISPSPMSVEEFHARRLAAYHAYYEHMPLPAAAMPMGADMRIYTQRSYGDLVSFYTLDQRQYRSPQACWEKGRKRTPVCAEMENPERTMLGAEQEAWLGRELADARTRWNVLVQGTVMSYIDEDPGPGTSFWGDAWNGYPAARRRLMKQLVDTRAKNPVVLTGDVHAFIVSGLHEEPGDLSTPIVATEIATTSVSSNGNSQRAMDVWRATNPNLLVAESRYRGYTRIELTRDQLHADLVVLDSEKRQDSGASVFRKIVIEADQGTPEAG